MLNPEDFPSDPSDVEQEAQVVFEHDVEDMVSAVVILGQLDPTEIDTRTMTPRWTEAQRSLILKSAEVLAAWRDL